jgi:aldose 1-epimerase
MIPLRDSASVDGTPFDFREAKPIGRDIECGHPQLVVGKGYDQNFVLNHPGLDVPSAVLQGQRSGIVMELYTTAPGLQLYTGNFLDGVAGRGGTQYPRRSAVCLEAQQYPDSPNRSWPESTGRLNPGEVFESTTIFKFKKSR